MSQLIGLWLCLFFTDASAHAKPESPYIALRKKYENLKKNDESALPFICQYITEAKKHNDYGHLAQGFKDAIFYSADEQVKLMYADSTIIAALKTGDQNLISNAYLGKGIIYYFNFKQFEPALNEYIKAYKYIHNSKDLYQVHKVKYHIGVVKSYLGFYDDALDLFGDCKSYFENQLRITKHPNLKFNYEKAYLNTMHQMIICHRRLKQDRVADSLIEIALERISDRSMFNLELSYLLKCKGISEFNKSNLLAADIDLQKAIPEIVKAKDFAWEAVAYYYLGKIYAATDKNAEALMYWSKVDSIFSKTALVLPEIRGCYEDLINVNHKNRAFKKELYYTKQLLKFDSILNKNFSYLSSKMHKQYDKQRLLEMKNDLEQKAFHRLIIAVVIVVLALFIISALGIKYRKEKAVASKYRMLYEKVIRNEAANSIKYVENSKIEENRKSSLKPELVEAIAEKLQSFEKQKLFLQKGLNLSVLAHMLDTNTLYLSTYINETREMNFSQYLNRLRIDYITELLFKEKRFLNYTVEALAEECGMASRQNFSDVFFEINGIRPTDFIKNRLQQIKNDKP